MTGTEIERLIVRLVGDTSGYVRAMEKAESVTRRAARRIRSSMNTIGKATLAIGGPVVTGALAKAVKDASDAQETMSKFETVFGRQSKAVKEFAADVANATNRSRTDIAGYLAEFQDLFVPLGMTADQAEEVSRTLTQLGIDLASFNNRRDSDAIMDLQSAMTGSGEVMKKYGVIVNEAAIKQKLLAQGLNPKEATEAQKAMARLNIILEGTKAAQGDAERTSGSFANQLKGLNSAIKDISIEVGTQLIPVLTPFVSSLRDAVKQTEGATKQTGWFGEKLGMLLDILHTVRIGFKYAQSYVTAFLATTVKAVEDSIQSVIEVLNKIPGVDIKANATGVLSRDLERLAEEQRKQAEELLLAVTPSERIAAAAREAARQAELAAKGVNAEVQAQEDLLANLEKEARLKREAEKAAAEQLRLYEDMAAAAHDLLVNQLTPLQALKREIKDVEKLMQVGALTAEEGQRIVEGLLAEHSRQQGTAIATAGEAFQKGSVEGYAFSNFGEVDRTPTEVLKKMLEKTVVSVRTEQEILRAIKEANEDDDTLTAAHIP